MARHRLLSVSPNLPCAMERQEWSLDDYHIGQTLYNGYAAQVYTATCKYSGMEVVLKVYHDVDKAPDVAQHEMYREVAIQGGLQHPNVVHLFGAFEEGNTLVIVQEYVPSGDLLALMQRHGGRIDESTVVKTVLRPLLGALLYLHRWGIVHRDVKPENVLFAADGTMKLADFGLAIDMREERPISRVGTLDYMAPEVLRCPIKQNMSMAPGPNTPAKYDFTTDAWAVGIVTYELLTGLPPYASECRQQAESRICAALPPIFPHYVSPMARDFILRLLAPLPADRPTVRQMLEHPWVVNPEACSVLPRQTLPQHRGFMSVPGALPTSSHAQATATTPVAAAGGYANLSNVHHFTGYGTAHSMSGPHHHLLYHPQHHQHHQPQHPQPACAPSYGGASPVQPQPHPHHPHAHHQQHQHQHQHLQPYELSSRHDQPAKLGSPNASTPTSFSKPLPTPPTPQQHQQYSSPRSCNRQTATINQAAAAAPPRTTPRPAPFPRVGGGSNSSDHSSASTSTDSAVSLSDQELLALHEKKLLDLSKLPVDQLQGMIQKLQQAMHLAVSNQQQQQQQQAAGSLDDFFSPAGRYSPTGVPQQTGNATAPAAAMTMGEDIHMADIRMDGYLQSACNSPLVPSPLGCYTAPLLPPSRTGVPPGPPAAPAPAAPRPCRATVGGACCPTSTLSAPHAPVGIRSLDLPPLHTGSGSGVGSPLAGGAHPSPVALVASTPVDTTPLGYDAFGCGASHRGSPDVCASVGVPATWAAHLHGYEQAFVDPHSPQAQAYYPGGAPGTPAEMVGALAPLGMVVGGGSSGGAGPNGVLHEGDGLVYVSIGSNLKAGGMPSRCEADALDTVRNMATVWMT